MTTDIIDNAITIIVSVNHENLNEIFEFIYY